MESHWGSRTMINQSLPQFGPLFKFDMSKLNKLISRSLANSKSVSRMVIKTPNLQCRCCIQMFRVLVTSALADVYSFNPGAQF